MSIPTDTPNIPRIGITFETDKQMCGIEWYGRGPHENYSDRKSASEVGIYSSSIDKWITPYTRPQENANRTDIRWAKLKGPKKNLIINAIDSPFSMSAWPYTQDVLEKISHDFELKHSENNIINIDAAQMGVGGDNSWGLPVNDPYLLNPGCYKFAFLLQVQ